MINYDLWYRTQSVVSQECLTNSKSPHSHVFGVYPTHIKYGHGAHLHDHAGRRYLDFICGLGPNLMGMGNEKIKRSLEPYLGEAYSLSFGSHHEVELAEQLNTFFPFCDQWKFLKTGSDACLAAVKFARAYTNRGMILTEGYHGWGDGFVSLTPPAKGVKDIFSFNKLSEYPVNENVAAVIVEPILQDFSPERIEYLQNLREDCDKHGALLIFDEIITGFRYKRHSVSQCYGILPDLVCLGKALGGGMALSAVGGKKEIMSDKSVFISSTFAGEILPLVASKAALNLLKTDPAYSIDTLWAHGSKFMNEFNSIAPEIVRMDGYPTRGVFSGDPLAKALFFQESAKAGILFGPSWWVYFPIVPYLDQVIESSKDILGRIKRKEIALEGELPQSPFSQGVRDDNAKRRY